MQRSAKRLATALATALAADDPPRASAVAPGIAVDDLMLWAARGIYANPLISQSQAGTS